MRYAERRRLSSRWVRYWTHHGRLATLLIILGWTVSAFAQSDLAHGHDTQAGEIMVAVLGGGVLLFGVAAGLTRWLVDPAARKIMAEHIAQGDKAHPGAYVTVERWEEKHDDLVKKVDAISKSVSSEVAALVSGEMASLRDLLQRGRKGGHE